MIETNIHIQYGPRKVRFFSSRPLGSAACLHDVQESREIWAGPGESGPAGRRRERGGNLPKGGRRGVEARTQANVFRSRPQRLYPMNSPAPYVRADVLRGSGHAPRKASQPKNLEFSSYPANSLAPTNRKCHCFARPCNIRLRPALGRASTLPLSFGATKTDAVYSQKRPPRSPPHSNQLGRTGSLCAT